MFSKYDHWKVLVRRSRRKRKKKKKKTNKKKEVIEEKDKEVEEESRFYTLCRAHVKVGRDYFDFVKSIKQSFKLSCKRLGSLKLT